MGPGGAGRWEGPSPEGMQGRPVHVVVPLGVAILGMWEPEGPCGPDANCLMKVCMKKGAELPLDSESQKHKDP